jgi:RNA polymerase sigma-70 factor, ECF subfamily
MRMPDGTCTNVLRDTRHNEPAVLGRHQLGEGNQADDRRERVTDALPARTLVDLARDGDRTAFESLVRSRTDSMFRLSLAILGNETDAADAVQEAFIGVWRQLPRLREPDRFEPWLKRIVVNSCRMSLRSKARRRVRELPLGDVDPEAARPRDSSDADWLRLSLHALTPDQRAILALHHLEGRPLAEIAETLAIPVGTAKSRLFTARAALLRALGEEGHR